MMDLVILTVKSHLFIPRFNFGFNDDASFLIYPDLAYVNYGYVKTLSSAVLVQKPPVTIAQLSAFF